MKYYLIYTLKKHLPDLSNYIILHEFEKYVFCLVDEILVNHKSYGLITFDFMLTLGMDENLFEFINNKRKIDNIIYSDKFEIYLEAKDLMYIKLMRN